MAIGEDKIWVRDLFAVRDPNYEMGLMFGYVPLEIVSNMLLRHVNIRIKCSCTLRLNFSARPRLKPHAHNACER